MKLDTELQQNYFQQVYPQHFQSLVNVFDFVKVHSKRIVGFFQLIKKKELNVFRLILTDSVGWFYSCSIQTLSYNIMEMLRSKNAPRRFEKTNDKQKHLHK